MVLVFCWGSAESRTHAAHYYVTSAAAVSSRRVFGPRVYKSTPSHTGENSWLQLNLHLTWCQPTSWSVRPGKKTFGLKRPRERNRRKGEGRRTAGVSPVDSGSTDGGHRGVDSRPKHRHSPLDAVWGTQNHHFVLHQVSSTGHTGHWVRHWSINRIRINIWQDL